MTRLICEESWTDWPAKHWHECLGHKFDQLLIFIPTWFDSLATGDATIGSYIFAVFLFFGVLGIGGAIFDATTEAIGRCLRPIEDYFIKLIQRHPKVPRWLRIGLINLIPAALIAVMVEVQIKHGWSPVYIWGSAKAIGIYYGIVGLFFACNKLVAWPGKRSEAKRREPH